ncbi:glycosyltransferase family 2 protein [Bacteroidota bacterium]
MLSIVLPSYYEEENIKFIYDEIIKELPKGEEFELIFVDDGSKDKTFENISILAKQDKRVKGIRLSRNFGHQVALLAGLQEAKGDLVISMDADGQHPPKVIQALLEKQKEGFDIVNTRRLDSKNTGWFKRSSSRWFYRMINMMSDVKIEPAAADFRLMTRKALDAYLEIGEHDRFTRGLVGWIGFKQAIVEFMPSDRHAGRTKYTFKRMRKFALDGITSFSSKPLRLSMYLGLTVFILAIVYAIYAIVMHFTGHTNPGWTSLLITILFLGGVQLFSIGIIGEYIARIFNEAKARPHYFISDRTE